MDTKSQAHRFDASRIDADMVRRFDINGPRYTSYPTADRFVEAFGADSHRRWLAQRNIGGIETPLSLYVHVPFCENICYYCACNKVITRDHSRARQYLDFLAREVALQIEPLQDRRISQLHWGGGTPTFLSEQEMRRLMTLLRQNFEFSPRGEYSIEIDPRTANAQSVALLAELGFNRMSLGVQDFDPAVQKAVNRIQSEAQTMDVLDAARANGFRSVNMDLIYGLPRQNEASFAVTLDRVLQARPDRLALYSYAHLPERFKPQRRIHADELPDADTRIAIFLLALHRLSEAGYVHIGMDHFALPQDELAGALRSGTLHRNFQGYSTQRDCDLLGLGVSAISKLGPSYSQSVRTLEEYYDCLTHDHLPIMRGIELTPDDLLRRAVIMALMCQGELSMESIEISYLIDFKEYFKEELEQLARHEADGLISMDRHWISVTPLGRLFVRGVCMVFDRYLRAGQRQANYSRVI